MEIDGKSANQTRYQVGRFLVDVAACTLADNSRTRRLEPKAMEVLAYLLHRPGRVISRAELEDNIWKDQIVGYDALSNAVIKIRRAFGDNARNPTVLETIPKNGFRLLADVRPEKLEGEFASDVNSAATQRHDLLKPSIAVLPFRSLESDSSLNFLKQGIAEDLIVDLSKSGVLFVIAASSSLVVDEDSPDYASALTELNTDYHVAGSFQGSESDVKVTVRLMRTASGEVIWADRFHQRRSDFLSLAGRIFDDLMANFDTETTNAVNRNNAGRGTDNELAYSHFLKGREQDRLDTAENNRTACTHFSDAIMLDAQFSAAYSHLSRNRAVCYINRWNDNQAEVPSEAMLQEAFGLAEIAVALASDNPHAHFAVAASGLWLRLHELAQESAEVSLEIDGNFAEGYAVLGMIHVYAGHAEQALVPLQTAMHHDPHFRDAYQHLLALALYHLGKYQESVDLLQQRLIRRPDSDASHMLLAACLGQQKQENESRQVWRKLLTINPTYNWQFKREILPYRDEADLRQLEDGLRYVTDLA